MNVIQQASDGLQAVRVSRDLKPDVVVMDLTMPGMNGIEATRLITNEVPEVKILCLSVHGDTQFISAVLDAGASGYLLKDCAFEELVTAIHTIIGKQIYLSPGIAGTIVDDYKARRPESAPSAFSQLTEREREIVQLLAEGQSTKEIAERLCLSVKTVGTHREHLMAKLHIHNLAQLTKYAIREGMTSVES
jgi:DNA-binding NarL/FixJ family response regulator